MDVASGKRERLQRERKLKAVTFSAKREKELGCQKMRNSEAHPFLKDPQQWFHHSSSLPQVGINPEIMA